MTTATATATRFADVSVHHATRAKAERLADMLEAEYPIVGLEPDVDDENHVIAWVITYREDEAYVTEDKTVPELADVLERLREMGLDPEAKDEEEEEAEATGSVVSETARARYKEVSDSGQSCGDWLAVILTNLTTRAVGDTKRTMVNFERLEKCFQLNDLDLTAPWATNRSSGWLGRYRMNGRQKLELVVALRSGFIDPDGEFRMAPNEFVADLRTRHAKHIAKIEKAAAVAASEKAA